MSHLYNKESRYVSKNTGQIKTCSFTSKSYTNANLVYFFNNFKFQLQLFFYLLQSSINFLDLVIEIVFQHIKFVKFTGMLYAERI